MSHRLTESRKKFQKMNEDALSIQRTGENSESQESPAITLPDLLPTPIPRPGQILFFDGSKKVTPGSGVDPRYSFGSVRHPKQPSLALLRYLSPSNEDYVSLGPSWVGNTQPDVSNGYLVYFVSAIDVDPLLAAFFAGWWLHHSRF